jgi:hypothetical protein
MTSNIDNIHDLQSIIDENKENLSDGSYLNICKLTQKIMDSSKNELYHIEYLETYVTKKDGDVYNIEFKPFSTYIKLSLDVVKTLEDKISQTGLAQICTHILDDSFLMLKINKQQLYTQGFCDECSEPVDAEIVIKNNILIQNITKC